VASTVASLGAAIGPGTRISEIVIQNKHVYEIHPRKGHRGVDLISDVLPFGRLGYDGPKAVANSSATDAPEPVTTSARPPALALL